MTLKPSHLLCLRSVIYVQGVGMGKEDRAARGKRRVLGEGGFGTSTQNIEESIQ
jgi:hypothetical protein